MKKLLPPLVFVSVLASGCCILGIGDCDTEVEVVNVDNLFWSAWRNPETFDTWLASQTVDPAASVCLRSHGNEAFAAEQNQLLQCDQLLTGSPAWNECHEAAESLHNRGVILFDIARTIDGMTRFDATEGGQYLILSKSILGEAGWNTLADIAQANAPPLECER